MKVMHIWPTCWSPDQICRKLFDHGKWFPFQLQVKIKTREGFKTLNLKKIWGPMFAMLHEILDLFVQSCNRHILCRFSHQSNSSWPNVELGTCKQDITLKVLFLSACKKRSMVKAWPSFYSKYHLSNSKEIFPFPWIWFKWWGQAQTLFVCSPPASKRG